MPTFRAIACAALIVFAHATAATAATTPTSAPPDGVLAVDTPRTTTSGNGFVVPAGWSIRTTGAAAILTAPEGGSHIALVDVDAADADAAEHAAWIAYTGKTPWPRGRTSDEPVRNGWTQVRTYRYDVPDAQQRDVIARTFRFADRWTVLIYDVARDIGAKREAQIDLVFGRLLPKGYRPETFAGRTAHKLDATRIAALGDFIEAARREFAVPGVAVGIVQDGKVVLAQGYGVRALGQPDPVDADTLFMAASNAKPLTTLMLAKQVDAGTFGWDTPVTQVLPSFKLGDAATTRQVLMKHLVCACTGLPRQDMEWVFQSEDATPASVMTTLATMQPTSRFGELYQYSNALAAAAGFVGGHALYPDRELGAAYDAAMQSLVLDPLGMTSSTFDYARALRSDPAMPHSEDIDGNTVRASIDLQFTGIPSRPEGGLWSNVNDMLRYVQMELDKGLLPDGTRYIGEAALLARRVQQVSRGPGLGYGIGLKIDTSSGTTLLHHGGNMFGYISDVMWLPEHGVGAVILTNGNSGAVGVRNLFRRRLLEVLFDGNPEAVANLPVLHRRTQEGLAAERKTLSVPADAAVVASLAKRYRSAELGPIEVLRIGDTTWFDVGGWRSEMASRRNDEGAEMLVSISPGLSGWLEFAVVQKEGERSLVLGDAQHEYVFREMP